jgi:hypothetical protein
MNNMHRVGAAFCVPWAILHVFAGASLVVSALTDINGHVREIGTAATFAQLPTLGTTPWSRRAP